MSIFDIRLRNRATGQGVLADANHRGELITAGGLPRHTEDTRRGDRYATMATGAVAALVARPTTTAALEIYNNTGAVPYKGAACSLVVTRLFAHWLVSSTTGLGSGAGIYAMVTVPKAAPTDAALAVNSMSGKAALGAAGQIYTAASATVIANGWFPYGRSQVKESAGAVVPVGTLEAEIDGRLIVPPGCSLCLHVVSGYTGDQFTSGAEWLFEPLTLE